jgi:hypothetical protein
MEDDYMNDKWITRGYSLRSNGYIDDKYSVIYGDKSSSGFYDDYYKVFSSLERRRQYTYDVETLETDEEKSARLLKEKAVKRNDKIDKLLENGGL